MSITFIFALLQNLISIEDTLFDMGVPRHTRGYKYPTIAIELSITEPGAITKAIYPEVAKRAGTTPINVERNIRFALDCTREKGLNSSYFEYFQRPHERPSNAAIVATTVQIVRERLEKESFGG